MQAQDFGGSSSIKKVRSCTHLTHPLANADLKGSHLEFAQPQLCFETYMSEIFSGIEGVEVIVDDLLILGENQLQHDEQLKLVLERARQKNHQIEISYIRHILGLKPHPNKV